MSKQGRSKPNVKKRVSQLLFSPLLMTLLVMGLPSKAYADTLTPPTLANVSASITKWANQYNIPPVVLKAVAWTESDWRQFNPDGSPLIGYDKIGIGIMQISDYVAGVTTDRLYDNDRIGTAVKVADKFVSATTAILAPSADANLVDALAAAPLAGKNCPILLTDNNTLTEATKAELIKLKVTKVYVVGAISPAVVTQVNAIPGVIATPLKGADRIATAALISSKLTNPAGSFVVGYGALPDALSVASYAAANNYSILVTNPDGSLPDSEVAYKGPKVYTVGGPTLVKDIVGANRLAGADRYATNKVVLDTLGYTYNKVYVANGTNAHLVDSLVASSLAALAGAPIMLTDAATSGDATAADIGAKLAINAVVVALGGSTVVTDNAVTKVTSVALARNPAQPEYINKLKTDYDFNISEGARILNQKWRTVPKIGDGDRNKLENWYFAVWAYNGWSTKNNPNYAKSQGLVPYQNKVFTFMGQKYNSIITQTYQTTITDTGATWDPSDSPPSYLSTWCTPTPFHLGDLEINPTLLLNGGGSQTEQANGDYWLNFHSDLHPTAIYSLGYYVTGYNATTGSVQDAFKTKLISAAVKVTAYGASRLNSAKTLDDYQVACKWFWAVLQLPNLDSTTWQKALDGYTQAQALQKTLS